jgi:hypothetical protein
MTAFGQLRTFSSMQGMPDQADQSDFVRNGGDYDVGATSPSLKGIQIARAAHQSRLCRARRSSGCGSEDN